VYVPDLRISFAAAMLVRRRALLSSLLRCWKGSYSMTEAVSYVQGSGSDLKILGKYSRITMTFIFLVNRQRGDSYDPWSIRG
jgi:hypothetical protein